MDLNIVTQIKIIEIDRIYPFEWSATNSVEMSDELSNTHLIRNPFPVTPLNDEEYILLADSGFLAFLMDARLPHLPVQVIPPDQLHFTSCRVGLVGYTAEHLVRLAAKYPEQILLDHSPQGHPPSDDFITIKAKFSGSNNINIHLRNSSRSGCPLPLEYLFRSIIRYGRYLPIVDNKEYNAAVTRTAPLSGIMTLPVFSLDDLRTAIIAERLFPPDIIEITSACRVLNIDFPLSVLKADTDAEEKESFFRDLISLRAQSHKVSYYKGQVYLLNH